MNYKSIRNNARRLYRQNFKLYILISIMIAIVPAYLYASGTLRSLGILGMIISFCAATLTYPLTAGNAVFFYNEYLGNHCKLADIFRFYRDKQQLVNALILGAIILLPNQIDVNSRIWLESVAAQYPSSMTLWTQTVPGLLIGFAVIIFFIRIYPAPYIFGLKPQMNPFSIIKTSFAKTKGYVLDYILFSLSVWWPLILSVILVAVTASLSLAALALIFVPLLIFFMPYSYLCDAGFSSEIINNGGEL